MEAFFPNFFNLHTQRTEIQFDPEDGFMIRKRLFSPPRLEEDIIPKGPRYCCGGYFLKSEEGLLI